jgi:hypothetical protein
MIIEVFTGRRRAESWRGLKMRLWLSGMFVVLSWVFAVSLVGCDPSYEVDGVVVDASGVVVANAIVTLDCYGSVRRSSSTLSGLFAFRGMPGCVNRLCTVTAITTNGGTGTASVASGCADVGKMGCGVGACSKSTVRITVRPRSAVPSAK